MGFYSVTLKNNNEPNSEPIKLLFPSSIIKDLFPINKEFTPADLLRAIAEAIKKCGKRLEETMQAEAIQPMCDNCKEASVRIGLSATTNKKSVFKVTESGDYFESIKNLVKQMA